VEILLQAPSAAAAAESGDGSVVIDAVNRKLLELLALDGRMSYAALGRHVHLTRAAVRDRVNSLVRSGVLERFAVIINPEKLGYTLSAFFEIDVEPARLEEVA